MLPVPYWKEKKYKKPCKLPPGRAINTMNLWERAACERLWDEGWKVYRRGWPDFVATRGGEIRFIEVKKPKSRRYPVRHLDPDQERMAAILRAYFGIRVELWNTYKHFGKEEFKNPLPERTPLNRVPRKLKKYVGYGEHLVKHPTQQKSLTETLPTQG
jgi:hypothetical protein